MCTEGTFQLECDQITYNYKKGDTVLIPAAMNSYTLAGKAALLEIYIS
jgi:mannose-6-phosphate isomerase